ncbi:MAG: ATP-binding protein [Spirulinaceae cyanobacterium]
MELFQRYTKILATSFLVVTLISLSLLGLEWHTAYQHELTIIQENFVENAINLDHIVESITNHLQVLRFIAEEDLKQSDVTEQDFYPAPLRSQLRATAATRYQVLPHSEQQQDVIGNLQGVEDLSRLAQNPDFEKEVNMALRLTSALKATLHNINDVTWAYYTSAREFMNLYPYDPAFHFDAEMLEYPFFKGGMPEQNPQRAIFWTPAYLDLVGQGLMVTAVTPIYEQEQFRGTVSLDLTLNILSRFVKAFSYPQGMLIVSGSDQQLLAHPSLITSADDQIKPLTQALPKALQSQIDVILQQPNGQVQSYGQFVVTQKSLSQVPWNLICLVPKFAIYRTVFANSLFAALIPLLGLGICLIFTSRILQNVFIKPTLQLTEYIQKESQGEAIAIPQNLPIAWQPWFSTISETFSEKRQLLQELEAQLLTLKETQLQLVQREKMSALGELVSGIAHEINNPTGFIKGNIKPARDYVQDLLGLIDLYQEKTPNPDPEIEDEIEAIDLDFVREDIVQILDSMNVGVARIQGISDSLRIFSRQDQIEKQTFDLHEGLDSTLLILKHRTKANESRPEIEIVKRYGEIPTIHCFPGQLNQVFMNIIANAIDAFESVNQSRTYAEITANPNIITIQTSLANDDQVQIQIKDNGSGMTPETQAQIFEQGFTTKSVGKGTGLGMAIAHQIITEKHGGMITCSSEVGIGTTFTITLPIAG